ncbi:MAG TPA: class I SAM-dependent methyltransferase [Thermoanaerobaculia bacterium]|nr:class I SAM-dependent methyltransferase [Thermoanaerobaculia bacterium]
MPAELVELVDSGGLPAGATALDVGCGSGLEAVYLARSGLSVIGVDSSLPALELARERARAAGVELDLRHGSALALPVEAGSIDLALDRGCLHGIEREDRPAYAAEIARVLRPGGRFLLRGAREDDEEQGVLGFDGAELDALFPAPAFARGPLLAIELEARAGSLPGNLALLTRAS